MEKSSLDYAGFRHEYIGGGLRRIDVDPNPIKQFHAWFAAAIKAAAAVVANKVFLIRESPLMRPRVLIRTKRNEAAIVPFRQRDLASQVGIANPWHF